MSLLHPDIVTIGLRRYRKNTSNLGYVTTSVSAEPYVEETEEMFIENAAGEDDYNDEACDQPGTENDFKGIEKCGEKGYKLTYLVHESYFGYIIGRNAEKKNKLEQETRTRIQIPKRGNKNDWLVIEGTKRQDIVSCKNRINMMIIDARHRSGFTHLVTFPLTFSALKDRFRQFEKQVLDACMDDRGIDDSIFQFPDKLHLTICTAVLLNELEVDDAGGILESCRMSTVKRLLGNKPLTVSIRGLEYMNDDPGSVDVLYAKVRQVDNANAIQDIADDLMKRFTDAGLCKRQYDSVKIHATVMNTLKRADNRPDATVKAERESFDARNILAKFGDYDFGTYDLEEIHLSLRYSVASDGYYECIHKIRLSD